MLSLGASVKDDKTLEKNDRGPTMRVPSPKL